MVISRVALAGVGAAMCLAGCTRSVVVTVTDASGVYDVGGQETRVRFTTDRPIDRYITPGDSRTASGTVFICGLEERYATFGDVRPTSDGAYEVIVRPMGERTVWKVDGEVVRGWPAEQAREAGICMNVVASEMLWTKLESNEVVLPR